MLKKFFTCSILFLSASHALVSAASASSLVDSTSVKLGFNFPNGDVANSSYDGPGFQAFLPFAAFVAPELLSVNAFTGQPLGSMLEFTLLSEAGAFDGTTAGFANNFGLKNSNGDFVSVIDSQSKGVGATGSLLQGANESFTLALQSPEALFLSTDGANPDGAAHMIAMKVTKAGEFEINPTSLRGDGPIKFNFLEGDIILFWEDMLASGNLTSFLVPSAGDFDYNDMVLVVRQTQVPEPATALLLGFAALGGARLRRRRA